MPNRAASRPIPRVPPSPGAGVTAIVLAAGRSARMGQPKPLLRLAGKPLLARTLDAVRASRVREVVVVLGEDADRVRREVPLDGTRAVLNEAPEQGMSSSIQAGLRAARPMAEAFLIVLADQPLVTAATLDTLIMRYEATHARILVPTFRGSRGNPVLLGRSLSPEIEALRGDVGCRGIVQAHAREVLEVPVDDPGILLDVDTPQDLARLEAALREGTPLEELVRR